MTKASSWFLILILSASVGVNILQAIQVRTLSEAMDLQHETREYAVNTCRIFFKEATYWKWRCGKAEGFLEQLGYKMKEVDRDEDRPIEQPEEGRHRRSIEELHNSADPPRKAKP